MKAEDLAQETFIQHFEAQFEELEPGTVKAATVFRQMGEWSSMQSLIVIASFDWEYGVTVTAEELKAATTVGDLYAIVRGKMAS